MKKILCLTALLLMLFASVTAFAEEVTIDVYDAFYEDYDSVSLMELDVSAKEELQEKLTAVWSNLGSEVQLYPEIKIKESDMLSLYCMVLFENPEYYYVQRAFSYTKYSNGYVAKVCNLKYTTTDKLDIERVWNEVEKATEEILFLISPDMTDFEKIMTVHDYMDLHYVYTLSDTDQTYLILLDKMGVCTAYAEAFQHIMNILGIECTLVQSDEMGHVWNMVKVDGNWYHIDITWDDPVPDQYAEVCHEYVLLSESAIRNLGHYGFTAPYEAEDTKYDNASWHNEMSSLVTVNGIMYRMEGNSFIDEEGRVIYKNLDGGDGMWNVKRASGIPGEVFAGLCKINSLLYFNTDTGIYSYNPKTNEIQCVLSDYGIFGLYADKNTIYYSTYDFSTGLFVKKGELKITDVSVGEAYYEDEKAVVRVYNDYDTPLWIISEGEGYKAYEVEGKSLGTARLENGSEQKIFIWKNNLEPVTEAFNVK